MMIVLESALQNVLVSDFKSILWSDEYGAIRIGFETDIPNIEDLKDDKQDITKE
ncbi:MAG: hypothetical protein ACFE8N_00330 [Promethearchaeota archaeon]